MFWCEFETLRERGRERELCAAIWWKDGGGVVKAVSEVIVWVSKSVSVSSKSSITWVGIWGGAKEGGVSVGKVSEQVTI